MKTFVVNPKSIDIKWHLLDADGKTLGRFASKIAMILMGKNKCLYTSHCDVGDYVVVVNAKKIIVTGNKNKDKIYYRHSGYMGGLKTINFEKLLYNYPERTILYAVRGMLPKSILGDKMFKKLKVYGGDKHMHIAQKPQIFEDY